MRCITRRFVAWRLALALVLLPLAGCGGGGLGGVAGGGNQVTTTVSDFVLHPGVIALQDEVTVLAVEEDSVTLGGAVPDLPPGSIVVKTEGDLTFVRRVVSVQRNGDQVVVSTVPAPLGEVYASAKVDQTEIVGARSLAEMIPAAPGLSIATTSASARGFDADGMGDANGEVLALTFTNFPVQDTLGTLAPDGTFRFLNPPAAFLDGTLYVQYGWEQAFEYEQQFLGREPDGTPIYVPAGSIRRAAPFTKVSGRLDIRCTGKGRGGTIRLPLARYERAELGPLAGLKPRAGFELDLVFRGRGEEGAVLTVEGGTSQAPGSKSRVGAQYFRTTNVVAGQQASWELKVFDDFVSTMRGSVSSLDSAGTVDCNLELTSHYEGDFLRPDFDSLNEVDVKGVKDFTITQDLLHVRLQAERRDGGLAVDFSQVFNWRSQSRWTHFANRQIVPDDPDVLVPQIEEKSHELQRLVLPEDQTEPTILVTRPGQVRLHLGESLDVTSLGAFPNPDAGGALAFRKVSAEWQIEDGTVASVDESRGRQVVLTGRKAGQTRLIVTSNLGGQRVGVPVEILPPAPQSLAVLVPPPDDADRALSPGEARIFRAAVTYSDGTVQDLSQQAEWSVGVSSVGEVEGGYFQAGLPGTSNVTASVEGLTGSVPVQVVFDGPITLLPTRLQTVGVGGSVSYRALVSFLDNSVRDATSLATWTSTDPGVAGITPTGVATGAAAGETEIGVRVDQARSSTRLFVSDPPVVSITVTPAEKRATQGESVQLTAVGTAEDGSSRDVTGSVTWLSLNPDVLSVSPSGLATALAPGPATVTATRGFACGVATFDLDGPVQLAFTAEPGTVTPNTPFSVTVQVRDLEGSQEPSTLPVTLSLGQNAAGAHLDGTLTVTPSGGLAVFDDLVLDAAGSGFTLVASAPGLAQAATDPFDVGGSAVVGHLFVANDDSLNPSLAVLGVAADGTPTPVGGSPYATSGRSHSVARVSNLVCTADTGPSGSRLSIFRFDPATGSLTPAASSPTAPFSPNFNPLHMVGNGTDAVFVVAEFDSELTALKLDPAQGSVLGTNTIAIAGGAQPNCIAVRAGTPDLVFVTQGRFGGPNQVSAFTYDRDTGVLAAGPVTTIPVGVAPTGIAVLGSRLYVTSTGQVDDRISVFDIDLDDGSLAFLGSGATGGVGSGALHHFQHAILGDVLYCANSDGTLSLIDLDESTGAPGFVAAVPVGDNNPHEMTTLALGGGAHALYATTSTRLAAFLIDPNAATLTALTGSPFSGFLNPFGITR